LANSFWQKEKGMKKMNSTLLFSRFRKPENFRKLLAKEKEEEIQEDAQRDSKVVKDCNNCSKVIEMQVKVLLL